MSAEAATKLAQAMRAHQYGDLENANSLYSITLELDPNNAQALRLQGALNRELGELQHSLNLLEKACAMAPNASAPLNELALSQMTSGDLLGAEQSLLKVLDIEADDKTALSNLGAILHHRGHMQKAIECYTKLLELDSNDLEVRCNLAKAYVDANNSQAAIKHCDIALGNSQSHPIALATKGAVLLELSRYKDALSLLDATVAANPQDDMALVNLAICQDYLKDHASAADTLRRALEFSPHNARAVADLANVYLKLGKQSNALQLCQEFLTRHPGECLVIAAEALVHAAMGDRKKTLELTGSQLIKTFEFPESNNGVATELNTHLSTIIASDPSLLADPVSKATRGGAQTGELDLSADDTSAALQEFFNASIATAVADYRTVGLNEHPVLAQATSNWSLRAWGTILNSGGYQQPHIHPLSWLSGVYYAQIPAEMHTKGSNQGGLSFGPAPARYCQANVDEYVHRPKSGQLVLFPSWMWHQTIPFSAEQSRVSIAFDVMPAQFLRAL